VTRPILLAATLSGAFAAPACGTVDVGPPTMPPMGCNGDPAFFVTDVWPKYLGPTPGYNCGQSNCHDATSGKSSFRLEAIADGPPDPTTPVASWPEDWRFDYASATRFLNCADPTSSRLLTKPTQDGVTHEGGTVVPAGGPTSDAQTLFQTWANKQ
jgi:hypothetical protein